MGLTIQERLELKRRGVPRLMPPEPREATQSQERIERARRRQNAIANLRRESQDRLSPERAAQELFELLGHTGPQDSPLHLADHEDPPIVEVEQTDPHTIMRTIQPEEDELDRLGQLRKARHELEVEDRKRRPATKGAMLGSLVKNVQAPATGAQQVITPCVYYCADTDEEAIPITIVAIAPPAPPVLTLPVRPFIRVKWGTRTPLQQIDVDVGVGCEFTVMGSTVLASVGADAVAGQTNPPVFPCGAMAGFGVWSGTSPVWRTHYYDALTPGQARVQNVPTMAVTLYAVHRSDSTVSIGISFLDAAETVLYDFQLAASSFFVFPIPIANDVASIRVTNNDVAKTVNVRAMFMMAL